MSEERTQYTVAGLQIENELLRERNEVLRKTVDGFTDASSFQWSEYQRRIAELEKQLEWQVDVAYAFMERHELAIKANMQQSETITAQKERIAELEQVIRDTENDLAATITAQARRMAELEATVQRLEQDNRRLRHLDAMPVGAIVSAMEWCDTTGADESIVNDIANFIATMDGDA